MKVDFLKRGDTFRLEFEFDSDEVGAMEQLLQIIPMYASRGNLEPARTWAKVFREVNGYRFIANSVREWWMDTLIEEELILEADTEEEHHRLLTLERGANGD